MKKVALGSDHAGYELKEFIKHWLEKEGYYVIDHGTDSAESVDYPDFALSVGKSVAAKEADVGILICGTGIGMSIAANKLKGVRAALCLFPLMAELARRHNDANVIALGGRLMGKDLAVATVKTFLNTIFDGGRHEVRVEKIKKLEGAE
ncbi:MAG: ribose 5-phosphate isomerase [Thermotogota bacterium]|nr:ribose 5-phosphate isomerase [Thermotogota bacterium]MDK2865117.1 ribose 5-phosphate isomerase [Thermotogota bacterium]HCZ06770.1 ribose 5-phosphate isomerase B [Thermotogota bacterium]